MKLSRIIESALNTDSLRGHICREKVRAIVDTVPTNYKRSLGSDALAEGWNNFISMQQNKIKVTEGEA